MSDEKSTPTIQIGRTPQGEIVSQTPRAQRSSYLRAWGEVALAMLGDPAYRYGTLTLANEVSASVKMQMLSDPVITLASAFISSKLVKAEYKIECADEQIRRFFEAMYGAFHYEFMLQAAMAVLFGGVGLIKKLEFAVPEPMSPQAPPVWMSQATPYICTGFRQTSPVGSNPTFDEETGEFTGFQHSGGKVDRVYALWVTVGKERAFGKYGGHGRLQNAYTDWWLQKFGRDLYVVYLQKNIDPSIIVEHPEGESGGKSFSEIARDTGDDVRGGSTVSMPSEVYGVEDPATGGERLTAIKQWTIRLLEAKSNVMQFHAIDDHLDARKTLAMCIPPQAFFEVKQQMLGGPTTAQVLGDLAVDLLVMDAVEMDTHVNDYLFPAILAWNFGPDAPPVRKKTVGLSEADRAEMFKVLEILLQKMDSDAERHIDVGGLVHKLGMPENENPAPAPPKPGEQPPEGPPEAGGEEPEPAPLPRRLFDGKERPTVSAQSTYDPKKNPPKEVLEHFISEPPTDSSSFAEITDEDKEDMARLLEEMPELRNLETVEVVERKDAGAENS